VSRSGYGGERDNTGNERPGRFGNGRGHAGVTVDGASGDWDEIVHRRWFQFRHERSAESFLALRQAVAQSPEYDPDSADLEEATALLAAGKIYQGYSLLRAMMPNWLLTPRVHHLASFAYLRSHQARSAEREVQLAGLVRQGILKSGTGEEAHPFLVLHRIDALDVLDVLDALTGSEVASTPRSYWGVQHRGPRQWHRHGHDPNGRAETRLIVWNSTDGTEVWFDTRIIPYPSSGLPTYGARDD